MLLFVNQKQTDIFSSNFFGSWFGQSNLDHIKLRKTLRLGILDSLVPQSIDYTNSLRSSNLDIEFARYYAEQIGVQLVVKKENNLVELFDALNKNEIDILASGVSMSCSHKGFNNSTAYHTLSQQLIYRKGTTKPRALNQFKGTVYLAESSSQIHHLAEWKKQYPDITWRIIPNSTPEKLIRSLAAGDIDFTVAESVTVANMQRVYPKIAVALDATAAQPISWCMNPSKDSSLLKSVNRFIHTATNSGLVKTLTAKYFDHITHFDYVDTHAFLQAIENSLPQYRSIFEKYAKEHDLNWHLLAAIAYQESHWNPNATSFTGVRGIMMLTQDTAKQMKVENRLDPEQSIRGGAAYLRHVLDRLPKSIPKDEKIFFALAAYNMGLGHVYDVRRLVETNGDDKNRWSHVKEYLPLLHQEKYYNKLKHGKASGIQAYDFVQNVQRYTMSLTGYLLEKEMQPTENHKTPSTEKQP